MKIRDGISYLFKMKDRINPNKNVFDAIGKERLK